MTLRRQTTSAAFWQILARGADRGLRFLASLVLTRLLTPDDFGQLAATMMVAGVVEALSYIGVDQAVVQSDRAEDPRFLGAVMRAMIVRGLIVAGVTAALAPGAAWYFEDAGLTTMVLIVAAMPLCLGLENPWMYVERKQLRFRTISIAAVAGALAQVAVSVGGAYAGLGAPALALGFVASAATATATGWLLVPKRVAFARDAEAATELGRFAKRAAGVPFLIMLSNSAPSIVLGRIAGLEVLGIYTLAQRLCSLPSEIALPIFGTVLTPAYAGIRDDTARVQRIWLKTLAGITVIVAPVVAALVVLDERLPRVLYGSKYAGAAGLVSLIAVAALASSLTSCCGPMFWGLGRPELDRRSLLIRVVLIGALAPFAAMQGGATMFAGSIAVALGAGFVYSLHAARRLVGARRRQVLRAMLPGAFVGGASLAACVLVQRGAERFALSEPVEVFATLALAALAMAVGGYLLRRGAIG
jgi:O-antigen/teichoic acid export membrane protein